MLDTATHNSVRVDPDVLIVGGGPAGMMCSLLLARLLDKVPVLRRNPGRIIGLGIRRERVAWPPAPGN